MNIIIIIGPMMIMALVEILRKKSPTPTKGSKADAIKESRKNTPLWLSILSFVCYSISIVGICIFLKNNLFNDSQGIIIK